MFGEFLKFCFCDQPPSGEIVHDGPGRVGDDAIIDPDETRAVLFEKNEIQEKGQDVLDGVEGGLAEDVHGDEVTRENKKIYKIFSKEEEGYASREGDEGGQEWGEGQEAEAPHPCESEDPPAIQVPHGNYSRHVI